MTGEAPPTAVPEAIVGLKSIAAHLGCAESTALAYSRLNVDPLPLRLRRGQLRATTLFLDEWRRRREGGEGLARLEGWTAISEALSVNRDTALQWAKLEHDPLPVLGMGTPKKTGRPWCYAAALRDWIYRHDLPIQTARRLQAPADPATPAQHTAKQARPKRVAA